MARSQDSASELPALLEERRKFESWLSALDARRATTAAHVFDRVKADYESRMRQVEERLTAHRHSIQEERTSLESRRSLLQAEEQLRADERAELELRSHVGELADKESVEAFRAVDESLEHLRGEREALDKRITELDALLGNPGSATAAPVSNDKSPDLVWVPPGAAATDAGPEAQTSAVPAVTDSAPSADSNAVADAAAAAAPGAPRTRSGSFDELAFLSEVVGEKEEDGGVVREDAMSLLDGVGATRPGAEPPLAANVPANTPIALRPSAAAEQTKTLKCNECGAMNYPTEWYCERCGAELAAL